MDEWRLKSSSRFLLFLRLHLLLLSLTSFILIYLNCFTHLSITFGSLEIGQIKLIKISRSNISSINLSFDLHQNNHTLSLSRGAFISSKLFKTQLWKITFVAYENTPFWNKQLISFWELYNIMSERAILHLFIHRNSSI